jgi:hypothetical protein
MDLPKPPGGASVSSDVGPSWMRPEESAPTSATHQADPGLSSAPAPWAVPASETPVSPTPSPTPSLPDPKPEEHSGGFPVAIFVILVVAIVAAIGIFLFANGAFPGT